MRKLVDRGRRRDLKRLLIYDDSYDMVRLLPTCSLATSSLGTQWNAIKLCLELWWPQMSGLGSIRWNGGLVPLERKLVSVALTALGFVLPTLSFGFCRRSQYGHESSR